MSLVLSACCILVCAVALGQGPASRNAEAPAPDAASARREKIAQAVRDLGADKWRTREEATRVLESVGEDAEDALQEAKGSKDPEVAMRAGQLLARLHFDLDPNTPPEIADLVASFRAYPKNKGLVVARLRGMGPPAYEALFLVSRSDLDSVIHDAMGQGRMDEVEGILRMRARFADADSLRDYATFLLLRGRLDEALAPLESAATRTRRQERLLVYLYRAKGDANRALQSAERAGDRETIRCLLIERADWAALKRLELRDSPPESDPAKYIEHLGALMAWHRLSQDDKEANAVCQAIRLFAQKNPAQAFYCAKALLVNDRPQDAIDVLAGGKCYAEALRLLRFQGKTEQALALLEKARKDPPPGSASGADAPGSGWQPAAMAPISNLGHMELEAACLLARAGRKEEANTLLADLYQREPCPWVVRVESELGLGEQRMDQLAHLMEKQAEWDRALLAPAGFPKQDPSTIRVWWDGLRLAFPNSSCKDNLRTLKNVLDPEMPMDFPGVTKLVAKGLSKGWPAGWPSEIALVCLTRKESNLAISILRENARDPKDWAMLADLLARSGHDDEAFRASEKAQAPYLVAALNRKAGRAEVAKAILADYELPPLGHKWHRAEYVRDFQAAGLIEEAELQKTILLKTNDPGSWEWWDAFAFAEERAVARKDFAAAALIREQHRLEFLRPDAAMGHVEDYLIDLRKTHEYRMQAHAAAGRTEAADEEAKRCRELLPGDADR